MPDPSQRARLLAVKLAALVRDHLGSDGFEPHEYGGGAALVDGAGEAWVLAGTDPARALGPAVAWALRRDVRALHLLAESATGVLARRAPAFSLSVDVWHVEGRTLLPAVAEPLPVSVPLAAHHEALRALVVAGGAEPVVEHGVLAGEVDGLEVCRVVTDRDTGAARLEVGVGAHDREAFALLHGDRPTAEALAEVVRAVRRHRSAGADPHPLNRLARERALRARLIAEPALVGAEQVVAVEPPVPRPNLKDPTPCVAMAQYGDGRHEALVCTSGVDLDAVPTAVDVRTATGVDQVAVVMPERDALPVQHLLAGALQRPVRVVTVQP